MTDRRKVKRLDYRVLHTVGEKVYKEESEVFRSASSTPTKSSEDDSAAKTLDRSELYDYQHVDEPFSNELSNLSLRLENIAMGDAERVKLVSVQEALREDIDDYIEENAFDNRSAIADIDSSITKIEELQMVVSEEIKDLRRLGNTPKLLDM